MTSIRLQRFLSQAGVAARRKAEDLITGGQVSVNGRVVTELGTRVNPARDEVRVKGRKVEPEPLVYVVLNKPKGVITSVSDPRGRKTVVDLIPDDLEARVKPVGRLDYYTEGVLLLTNDGELAAALLDPNRHVEKTYHAKIRGRVDPKHIEVMRKGVRLPDRRKTRPAQVDVIDTTGRHTWLVITLREGRSRQIHKMAEALGYQVIKLARVAFAGITFEGLRIGQSRRLTQREVKALRTMAGLTASTPPARSRPRPRRRS